MIDQVFLRKLCDALEDAGVPYMLAGSVSAMMYGETRNTHDVDFVIDPTQSQLSELVKELKRHFIVQEDFVLQAMDHRSMFNVIDPTTYDKADFFFKKPGAYFEMEFSRRTLMDLPARDHVSVVSPEDCILSKLRWAKMGESERQFRDAVGVASVQLNTLDRQYVTKWASELEVSDLLVKLWPLAEKLAASRKPESK